MRHENGSCAIPPFLYVSGLSVLSISLLTAKIIAHLSVRNIDAGCPLAMAREAGCFLCFCIGDPLSTTHAS